MNEEQKWSWRRIITYQRLPAVVAVVAVYILILVSTIIRELTESKVTLWEWVGVLIIPVALLAAGSWYTSTQAQREKAAVEDRAQDEALQLYLDQMSNLLIEHKLYEQSKGSAVPLLAVARTTTVLLRLDKNRKRHPLKLVYRLRLINRDGPLLDLENADLQHADLSEIKLSEACLRGVDLRRSNLRGSNLNRADLTTADLRGADLRDTNLSGASLKDANLLPYDEQNPAKLSFHNLNGADPSGINLSRFGTNLSGANLSGTNLSGAILSGADLSGAYLSGADLSGTYLKGAIGVTTEELERQAKTLKGATMPDGSKHD